MTIFKDRLPATIRIKRRFALSAERLHHATNAIAAFAVIALGMYVPALLLDWLAA